MQFNIMPYTLFLYAMFMVLPSQIFAAWTLQNPPTDPKDGVKRTCAQWILFNGFTNNHGVNRDKAKKRNIMGDRIATTWAATFAFKIGGIRDLYNMLPSQFCSFVDPESTVPKDFVALENDKHTCENWIKMYRFNDIHEYNYTYARNLNNLNAVYISFWAYSYWHLLWFKNGEIQLTPRELCSELGQSVGENAVKLPFISEHDWLRLYNVCAPEAINNVEIARTILTGLLKHPSLHVQYFVRIYVVDLVTKSEAEQPIAHLTPQEICKKYDGNGPQPRKYKYEYLA